LSNAITVAEENVLGWMFNNEGHDLITAFSKNIKALKIKKDSKLLISVLESIKILLDLSRENKENFVLKVCEEIELSEQID
jgi:hypothetical protein